MMRPDPARGAKHSARDLPWQVWGWLALVALAGLVGIYWLVRPSKPDPIVPILGHADHGPAPLPPKPKPTPRSR